MGCMYFYIKEQLTEFVHRLRKLKVNIHIYNLDARDLPVALRQSGLTNFDRVDVSNITDHAYVGIKDVLEGFSPFLNAKNPYSAIIGLFMNWPSKVPEGVSSQGPRAGGGDPLKSYLARFPVSHRLRIRNGKLTGSVGKRIGYCKSHDGRTVLG